MARSYKSSRYSKEGAVQKEYSWFGGFIDQLIGVVPTSGTQSINAGGIFSQRPRFQVGPTQLDAVAFPIGITRRPCTIRRTIMSGWIYDTDFRSQPANFRAAFGCYRRVLDDAQIADPALNPVTIDLDPADDYRDSWMIHDMDMVPAFRQGSSTVYNPFRWSFDWDTENMRKFDDNEALVWSASVGFVSGTQQAAITCRLALSYRFLVQW